MNSAINTGNADVISIDKLLLEVDKLMGVDQGKKIFPQPRIVPAKEMLPLDDPNTMAVNFRLTICRIRKERLREAVALIPGIKPERWVSVIDPEFPTEPALCLVLKNERILKFRCLDAGIICNTRFKEVEHYKTEPIEKMEGWYHFIPLPN